MKTRFRPRLRSYVCRDRPTDVVIWNVVLPRGMEVNGTLVGETNPTVYRCKVNTKATWPSKDAGESRRHIPGMAQRSATLSLKKRWISAAH